MNSRSECTNHFFECGSKKPVMRQIINLSFTVNNDQLSNDAQNSNSHLSNVSSNIYINPLIYKQNTFNSAIHFNNTRTNLNANKAEPRKTERVYYNPKFFKNNNVVKTDPSKCQMVINDDQTRKRETNIHVNPLFIQKQSSVSVPNVKTHKEEPTTSSSIRKLTNYGSGIYVNPKFLQDNTKVPSKTDNDLSNKPISIIEDKLPEDKYVSKYKIDRKKPNSPLKNNPSNLSKIQAKKQVSLLKKYKLKSYREKYVYLNNSKYNYINKYSFKKSSNDKITFNSQKTLPKPILYPQKTNKFSYESRQSKLIRKKSILQQKIEARRKGKLLFGLLGFQAYMLNSKYKYRRAPESVKSINTSPSSHYNKHHYHKADKKYVNQTSKGDKSVYKKYSETKIVRKSILQAQIESRHHAKKSLLQYLQRSPKKIDGLISKYKIVHNASSLKKNLPNKRIPALKKNPMKYSSNNYRTDKLKRLHILTKILRKDNQLCTFYNRYGRCKGKEKGSCPKVHDPKYLTICKKFLKGECKEAACNLSHDVRPEKMPTCYHYLAGLCKRKDCPYLHIKVNGKAPICRAFLQGFCADVFNCNKRHEFICPMYAEKGHCPKGKSCSLPHRTHKTRSKLLEPDQFPILSTKTPKKNKLSDTNKKSKVTKVRENDSEKDVPTKQSINKQKQTKEFQRYFLASLPSNDSVIEAEDENVNNENSISTDSKESN